MSVPTPLEDRVGHVGGIEAVLLDDQWLYFGFDYQSDLVLSPLIPDADDMAQFAALYLRQRDGTHDAAYWLELVQEAEEVSNLSDHESRTLTTAQLLGIAAQLRQSAEQNIPAPDLEVPYHLLYLLGVTFRLATGAAACA